MQRSRLVLSIGALLLVVSMLLMVSCTGEKETAAGNDEKITVAVSIIPQKTFAEAVCGDLAEVVALIPPGYSPGNYEPTPVEMEEFSKASIYFTIGVPTETANILPKAGNMKVVMLQDEVAKKYPDREFAPGKRDPHTWLSPKRAKTMVEVMAREMSLLDEKNQKTYEENAQKFIEELDQLDQEIKISFEGVNNRKFIVFHPAYGYLADDYNLQMYALEQDGKEATPQHLQEMIDLAKRENIKVIFSQEEIDSKQPDAFAEEIGGKKALLAPLAADYILNLTNMAKSLAEAMR